LASSTSPGSVSIIIAMGEDSVTASRRAETRFSASSVSRCEPMSCRIATTPLALSRASSAGCSATLTQCAGPSGGMSIASKKAEPALPSPTRARFCSTRLRSSAAKSSGRTVPDRSDWARRASSPKAELAYCTAPFGSVTTTATRSVSKMRLKSSLAMVRLEPTAARACG
jgi:hypothetical protein